MEHNIYYRFIDYLTSDIINPYERYFLTLGIFIVSFTIYLITSYYLHKHKDDE